MIKLQINYIIQQYMKGKSMCNQHQISGRGRIGLYRHICKYINIRTTLVVDGIVSGVSLMATSLMKMYIPFVKY